MVSGTFCIDVEIFFILPFLIPLGTSRLKDD